MAQEIVTAKELRQFGWIVGGVFSIIGLWPLIFRGEPLRFWAIGIGGILILLGALLPRSLRPIQRVWMAVGHVLGWLNTRIILGIVFFGLITPMGIVMRLLGKDPLRLSATRDASSYRVVRTPRPRTHMRNQF